LQDPQKFNQIGIFGLKIFHLATLLNMCEKKWVEAGTVGDAAAR
jgi:hypothetical protein